MTDFHGIVDEVLIVEELFKILINVAKVGIEDFADVIQLATDAA